MEGGRGSVLDLFCLSLELLEVISYSGDNLISKKRMMVTVRGRRATRMSRYPHIVRCLCQILYLSAAPSLSLPPFPSFFFPLSSGACMLLFFSHSSFSPFLFVRLSALALSLYIPRLCSGLAFVPFSFTAHFDFAPRYLVLHPGLDGGDKRLQEDKRIIPE